MIRTLLRASAFAGLAAVACAPGGVGAKASGAPPSAVDAGMPERAIVVVPPAGSSARPAAAPAAPVVSRAHVDRLVAAVKAFAATGTHEEAGHERYDIVWDEPGVAALASVKDAALDIGLDVVGALGAQAAPDDAMSSTFRATLEDAGVAKDEDAATQGMILGPRIARIAHHADKFAIDFGVLVQSGLDDATSIVRIDAGGRATPLLTLRNDGYRSITGARAISAYAVSPPDASGRWFVVDAFSHPWIASRWRGITYAVYEPGPSARTPRVLQRVDDSACVGGGAVAEVRADVDSFTVSYESWDGVGQDVDRPYVRRYRVGGGAITRVAPWVVSPAHLVDEWIHADESVAQRMVDDPARAQASALRRRLRAVQDDLHGTVSVNGSAEPVDVEKLPDRVVVKLDVTPRASKVLPKAVVIDARRDPAAGWTIASARTE